MTTEDNPNQDLEKGDKVKCYTAFDEKYHRGVTTEINHEEETAQVLYLEGGNKGEIKELDFQEIRPLKQSTWLCLIGLNWGVSQEKEQALSNALTYWNAPEDQETATIWIAEVDRNNWNVGYGGVTSTFIDNEEEIEVETEKLEKVSRVAQDLDDLSRSALRGREPEWSYLKEVRK